MKGPDTAIAIEYLDSPVGFLKIVVCGESLRQLDFVSSRTEPETPTAYTERVKLQLEEYFRGTRQSFQLSLAPEGTPFQKAVWEKLIEIPYANLISYKDLALKLGDMKKIRAVGSANGRNPITIIIPCHRVIGSDKNLIGYSGGLHIKRWLIDHENVGMQNTLFG